MSNVIQDLTHIRPVPTPTDAYLTNPVTQQRSSTADPLYFCLPSEAQKALQLMQAEGAIPPSSKPQISEMRFLLPGVVYGSDGRQILVIEWTEQNPDDAGAPFYFGVLGGELDFQLKCFPEGYGDWMKNYSAGEIDRKGRIGGAVAQAGPGHTYKSVGSQAVLIG